MPIFPVNTTRLDPYKSYRFLVYFGQSTTAVAGVSKVTALKRSSDVIEYKEGGNDIVLKGLGRTTYDPITLERGVTYDTDFITWADTRRNSTAARPPRRSPTCGAKFASSCCNEDGNPVTRTTSIGAGCRNIWRWPTSMPADTAVVLEHIKLENEGWEVDPAVVEVKET